MATLILPGWQGSGPEHWQSHWLDRLDRAMLVRQRDWDHPDLDDWLTAAVAAIREHPNPILVGHSLGAILIAHLASRRPDLAIAGALLVAPADVDNHAKGVPALASFAPIPTGPLGFPAIVVGSRNDPWMPAGRARALARMWEADYVDAGRAGHINAAADLGVWPEGQQLLARLDAAGSAIEPPVELNGKRRGATVDPLNPIFREVGRNAPNSRLRSRPDAAY